MANTIILKKSSVAGKIPLAGDLVYGELALNYVDGLLYYKTASNAVTPVNAGAISSGTHGAILYQISPGVTGFIGTGTTGQVLTMGATTATWSAAGGFNGGTITNPLVINNATASASTITGALQVIGGTGIGGNLYVGGNIYQNGVQVSTTIPSEVFTFGGTGTPTIGTSMTPYVRVMSAVTSASASLLAKSAPTGNFTVSILRSANNGVTFPDTITTITVTSGNIIGTATPTTALAVGDLLRLDISAVNGAADWTAQLQTV